MQSTDIAATLADEPSRISDYHEANGCGSCIGQKLLRFPFCSILDAAADAATNNKKGKKDLFRICLKDYCRMFNVGIACKLATNSVLEDLL